MTSRTKRPHSSTLKQITTRILPDSVKLLEAIAFEERRTVSAQLAFVVEKFLADEKKKRSKTGQPITE